MRILVQESTIYYMDGELCLIGCWAGGVGGYYFWHSPPTIHPLTHYELCSNAVLVLSLISTPNNYERPIMLGKLKISLSNILILNMTNKIINILLWDVIVYHT